MQVQKISNNNTQFEGIGCCRLTKPNTRLAKKAEKQIVKTTQKIMADMRLPKKAQRFITEIQGISEAVGCFTKTGHNHDNIFV